MKKRAYHRCGCKAGVEPGVVLDPFIGSGTTALVARELGRRYIGIELNPSYVRIATQRLRAQGTKSRRPSRREDTRRD